MTGFDKKYAFICELTPSKKPLDNSIYPTNSNGVKVSEIRRKPMHSYLDANKINAKKLQPIVPEINSNKGMLSLTGPQFITHAILIIKSLKILFKNKEPLIKI